MKKALILNSLLVLFLFTTELSHAQVSSSARPGRPARSKTKQPPPKNSSTIGLSIQVIRTDHENTVWVGGSFFTLQGFLLRIKEGKVKTIILPGIAEVVEDIYFTTARTGWMLADYRYLYSSRDGGLSWQKSTLNQSQRLTDVYFVNDQSGWVIGWNGVIYHTNNGGQTWNRQDTKTKLYLKKVFFIDSLRGWILGGDTIDSSWSSILLATSDGGATWTTVSTQSSSALRDLSFVNEHRGCAIDYSNRIVCTADGGQTWEVASAGEGFDLRSISFSDDVNGFAVGENLLTTSDGGRTWEPQNDVKFDADPDRVFFIDRLNGWAVRNVKNGSPKVIWTTDGGLLWKVLPNQWRKDVIKSVERVLDKDATR